VTEIVTARPITAAVMPAYEQLRSGSILGHSRGPGYTLLLTRGMAAWMHTVDAILPAVHTQKLALIDSETPAAAKNEIIKLLANMIFTKQREVAHGGC